MKPLDVLDVHLSVLAGWVVQTVGRALALGFLVAGAFGVLAVITGAGELLYLAAIAGGLVPALYLASASPPMPDPLDEDD